MTRSAAATARRAEKRQRSIEEQKKVDGEQEAARKASELAGGDKDEWDAAYQLVCEYKEQQGKKW